MSPASAVLGSFTLLVAALLPQAPAPRRDPLPVPEPASLVVRTLDCDGKTALGGVEILFRRSLLGTSSAGSIVGVESTRSERVHTDGGGRATFSVVRGATYEIVARRTPLFVRRVALDVAPSGSLAGVAVVFQPSGVVGGRLTSSTSVDFTRYALEFVPRVPCASFADNEELWWGDPEAAEDDEELHAMSSSLVATVAADGSFRAGPLPIGETDCVLLYRHGARATERLRATDCAALETWSGIVERGEQRWTRDVGEHVPGTLALACTLRGVRHDEVVVELVDAEAKYVLAELALDANGHAPDTTVLPGSCRVRVCARDGAWVWRAPDEVRVAARVTTRVEYDVTITTGTVRLLDALSRSPVAGVRVRVHDTSGGLGSQHTTNARGELTLSRPAGRQHACIDDARWADVSIDWTETGPASSELAVRRLRP